MGEPLYPSLYQINTRVWLTELSQVSGRAATLDDIADAELDRLAKLGFDWIWFLSVWRTGSAGQQISRSNQEWRREFKETLPDLSERTLPVPDSRLRGYMVHPGLGGDAALSRLRERLRSRGLRLMLDFVPNHTAVDHSKGGDPTTITGYLGTKHHFEKAMGTFALAYADQAERDHAALKAAVRAGKIEVLTDA